MACPQVMEAGGSLNIWTVAANIFNKQLQAGDKGWAFSLGIGQGANKSPL